MSDIIQSMWWGRLGTMEQLSAQSYMRHGHPFHLYIYDVATNVPDGVIIKDGNEIVPKEDIDKFSLLAQFADWFRYNLLYQRGGWWVDLDTVCLRPFDIPDEHVFTHEWHPNPNYYFCNNAYMKAPAGSPAQAALVQLCKERPDWKNIPWSAFGPEAVSWASQHFQLYAKPFELFNFITPYRYREFTTLPLHNIPKDAYAAHLWRAMWRDMFRDGRPFPGTGPGAINPDGQFPAGCFYERMKAQYGVGSVPLRDVQL